jgi:hypothetical protein
MAGPPILPIPDASPGVGSASRQHALAVVTYCQDFVTDTQRIVGAHRRPASGNLE